MKPFQSILSAFVISLAAASLMPHSVRAGDLPPGTPADIQKIVARLKAGGMPTAADLKRLQEWGTAVGNAGSGGMSAAMQQPGVKPKNAAAPDSVVGQVNGIPCLVTFTTSFSGKAGKVSDHGTLSGTAKCILTAHLGGNADYYKYLMDPSVKVSSFMIVPAANTPGSGSYSYHSEGAGAKIDTSFSFTEGGFSTMLVTTGSDSLLAPTSCAFGGRGSGTTISTPDEGTPSTSTLNSDGGCGPLTPVFVQESQEKPVVGSPSPKPTLFLSYKALAHGVQTSSTVTVSGGEGFDVTIGGTHYTGSSSISITLNPKTPKLELVVEPQDESEYEKWIPQPDSKDAENSDLFSGLPISVHVVLHDKNQPDSPAVAGNGATQPNVLHGGLIKIDLSNIIKNKGVCMNFPQFGSTKDSLYFPKDEQGDGIDWIDESHVQTKDDDAIETTVVVRARDTGAYGELEATCDLLELKSTDPRTNEGHICIPIDDNHNHISDAWEKSGDIGVYDDNYAADWDDSDIPTGMRQTGDGLSIYEKYRGFLVDDGNGAEKFSRIDPKVKNLFVYVAPSDPSASLLRQGARNFGAATGIGVNFINSASRMQEPSNGYGARWINFNKTEYTNGEQAAVLIKDMESISSPGLTQDIGLDPTARIETPTTTQYCAISRSQYDHGVVHMYDQVLPPSATLADVLPSLKSASQSTGISLNNIVAKASQNDSNLVDEAIVAGVVHELGHSLGAQEHGQSTFQSDPDWVAATTAYAKSMIQMNIEGGGDQNCPMRYWHTAPDKTWYLEFLPGKWNPANGPYSGGQWAFCQTDWAGMSVKP